MRPAVRLALVVLGLAAAVYGTASLTGGWLGTPPWWGPWERHFDTEKEEILRDHPDMDPRHYVPPIHAPTYPPAGPRPGREWISGGVVAAGFALAAFGAWPRRRTDVSP